MEKSPGDQSREDNAQGSKGERLFEHGFSHFPVGSKAPVKHNDHEGKGGETLGDLIIMEPGSQAAANDPKPQEKQ